MNKEISTAMLTAGQKIGLLELVRSEMRSIKRKDRPSGLGTRRYWFCRCDCGNEKWIDRCALARQRSCGCMFRAYVKSGAGQTHGMYGTRTYNSWRSMITRCENPRSIQYRDYGGRGITVCARWKTFANFLADMGERPQGCTIERNENDKGYSPDNCRWASRREQSGNKRNSRVLKVNGKAMPLADAAEALGIKYSTAYYRLTHGGK